MKKIMMGMLAAVAMLLTGCDDTMTPEKMGILSKSVGYAAGVACELTKVDDTVKANVSTILNTAASSVPASDKTFVETWTPIVDEHVSKLVTDKKITDAQGIAIKAVMTVAEQGLDYMFTVRWPEAKKANDLIAAGISGFTNGFTSVIGVPATERLSATKFELDEAEYLNALKYLQK